MALVVMRPEVLRAVLLAKARVHRVWSLALLGRHDELLAAAPGLLKDKSLLPYSLEIRYLAGRAAIYQGKRNTGRKYLGPVAGRARG